MEWALSDASDPACTQPAVMKDEVMTAARRCASCLKRYDTRGFGRRVHPTCRDDRGGEDHCNDDSCYDDSCADGRCHDGSCSGDRCGGESCREDVLTAAAVMKAKAVTVGEMKPVTVRMAAKFIAG